MTRRFWWGLAPTLALLGVAMGGHGGRHGAAPRPGRPPLRRAAGSCSRRRWCWWAAGPSSSAAWLRWSHAEAQHVHPHRHRHRRRLPLQRRRRGAGRPASSRPPSGATAAGRRLLRGGGGHHRRWCCLGQVLELRARSRPPAPSGRCWAWRRRRRAGSSATAARRTCRLTAVQAGDRLRVRPGREDPGRRHGRVGRPSRSTSRWSPASRCRSRSAPATRVIGGTRERAPARFVMRAERVGSETLLAADRPHGERGAASRAPIQRLADVVSGWFVPAVVLVGRRHLRRLGGLRPGAAPGARAGQRRGGADHRLPVRAGPGHADVDHGRQPAAAPQPAC